MNLFLLSNYNVASIISFLDVRSLCALDSALCNREYREIFLQSIRELKAHEHKSLYGWLYGTSAIKWIISRRYSPRNLLITTDSQYLLSSAIDFSVLESIGLQKSKFFSKTIYLPQPKQISDGDLNFIYDCPQLTSIDLLGCQGITDFGLRLLGQACPQLESINLQNCRGISDNGVSELAQKCSKLKDIDLIGCDTLTNRGISILAEQCPLLQSIKLDHTHEITARSVCILGHACRHLKHVMLNCCINITGDDLVDLARQIPQLRSISLKFSTQISEEAVGALRIEMPQLQIITHKYYTSRCLNEY
jgi:hypothetical protein